MFKHAHGSFLGDRQGYQTGEGALPVSGGALHLLPADMRVVSAAIPAMGCCTLPSHSATGFSAMDRHFGIYPSAGAMRGTPVKCDKGTSQHG